MQEQRIELDEARGEDAGIERESEAWVNQSTVYYLRLLTPNGRSLPDRDVLEVSPTPTSLHPTTNQILFFQCSLTGTVSFYTVQPNMVYWMCNSKQVTLDCILNF